MRYFSLSLIFILKVAFCATAADDATTNGVAAKKNLIIKSPFNEREDLKFTTRAYNNEALQLVIREANQVAGELRLQETLPITESNLIDHYISPFGMTRMVDAIGNVTTTNYTYYCSVGGKFSFLSKTHLDANQSRWMKRNWLPIGQLDTNGAYELATQWLNDVSMDVTGLNNDCYLHVEPYAKRGRGSNAYFLPIYWVYWTKDEEEHGAVASVEFFAPTKTLMQLRVEDSDYILRQPLQFTNLNVLLSQKL